MPEKEVEDMSHGLTTRSFQVFAEWMRENRRAMEERFTSQDVKLAEIHAETKKTNGRVTELEKRMDFEDGEQNLRQVHDDKRSLWIKVVVGSGLTALGGSLGYLGHAAGLW